MMFIDCMRSLCGEVYFFLITLFNWLYFFEWIDFSEAHGSFISIIIVDNYFVQFFLGGKSVLAGSGLPNKFIGKNLNYLRSVIWTISLNFPFIKILLRMELSSIEWPSSWFGTRNELLIEWWFSCWYNIPEIFEILICCSEVR